MKKDAFQDLQQKDLNQVVTLAALLTTGGVSRAAEALEVSQPTVSKALTRLRETFGDPLLVREGNDMHLTPVARELLLRLEPVIAGLNALYHPPGPFDPQTVRGVIRLAANDYIQSVLALPFARLMRTRAPNVAIELRGVGTLYPEQLLAEGFVDIALGSVFPFSNLHHKLVMVDPFVCVADAADTALPARMTMDQFLQQTHVDVSPTGTGVLRRHFERSQRRFKEERKAVVQLSSFSSVPAVLEGTSLVALIPRRMFDSLPSGSLKIIDLDFQIDPYEAHIWWHPQTHTDPLMSWARMMLMQMAV
jgi:DNA-binding transcriptional LysR family regulator